MKYSLRSPFARITLALFIAALIQAALGRLLALMPSRSRCLDGLPCAGGLAQWQPSAHFLAAAVVGLLALAALRLAWRDYRSHRFLLPLTTVSMVLFFGQSLVGAVLLARGRPAHLVTLHALSALMLWISLSAIAVAAGVLGGKARPAKRIVNRRRAADFLMLSKPLIVSLLLLTTYGGLVLGSGGWPSGTLTFWTLLGGALAAGGSGALNQYVDRDLDRHMVRTAKRPLAEGRLSPAEGLAFGLALCLTSYYVLASFVNFLAALLSLAGILYYAVLYSLLLKKATVQNIVIGGGAGAIPPMVGWAAATGSLGLSAWLLFAIVFMWTPPHFWALALVRRKDYERAGVPMLPVVRGEVETRRQVLVYTVALVATSLLLPLFRLTGPVYLVAALILGGLLLYAAVRVWRGGGNRTAWTMYRWSSMYLALLFLVIIVDAVSVQAP